MELRDMELCTERNAGRGGNVYENSFIEWTGMAKK